MVALKLLSLAAAATATSASINSPLAAAAASSTMTPRSLQDATGNTYTYLDDLTGYSLQYSNCVRVKVPKENDDDDGNVNFYNGSYRAQYAIYATFHVCGDGDYNNENQCSACDYGVVYATEVNTFLETGLEYFNQGGDDDGNANDETNYMECQEGIVEDDMQLYYGPACDDGQLKIGVFYDDECTIKTNYDSPEFDYGKFGTVETGCVDCSSDEGQEACADLYDGAFHCFNGKDQTGQDGMSACSKVLKATTSVDYGKVKKRTSGADTFMKALFPMLIMSLLGGFFFLSYTYYIRHKGEKGQPMLSCEDLHEDSPNAGTLT